MNAYRSDANEKEINFYSVQTLLDLHRKFLTFGARLTFLSAYIGCDANNRMRPMQFTLISYENTLTQTKKIKNILK